MHQTMSDSRRSSTPFARLFLDHPREVGETYWRHMAASGRFGLRLLALAGGAFLHALAPGVHRSALSDAVPGRARGPGGRGEEARDTRMRDAGVWDVGL